MGVEVASLVGSIGAGRLLRMSPGRAKSHGTDNGVVKAACNLCEAICGVTITVAGGEVVDLRGDPDDPLSRGHVCPKSVAMVDVHRDPSRLRRPIRKVDGRWVEVSWAEAVDAVAEGLARVRRTSGSQAVAVYLGNPTVHSLGAMTHGTAFATLLQTPNRFSATSVDQLPHQVVSYLLYGHQALLPEPDLDRTQYLLVFGANPRASNGSMMTAPDMGRRLHEIRARGGRVVVFDPRRSETAGDADEHIPIRPGTDAAVLLAMLNVVLDDVERTSRNLAPYLDGLDDLRRQLSGFTPAVASALSGVPATVIERIAREFVAAPAAACYGRVGVSTQRHGTVCHWAIQVLNILSGNLGRSGGTLFADPAISPTELVPRGGLGGRRRSRVRGLPGFGDELPVSILAEEIITPGQGQVRALLTVGGNPVLSTPAGDKLAEALDGLEFQAAVDFYLNETTSHADVILPPTNALERDHYDLIFRAFGVRNTAKYSPAVLKKPAGSRHDWEIFRDLGRAYRNHLDRSWLSGLRRRADPAVLKAEFQMRLNPRRLVNLLLITGQRHLTVRALLKHPSGLDLGPLRPGVERKLKTRGHRINLVPDPIKGGIRALHEDLNAERDPDALLLIGRRHVRSNNSWMHNSARLVAGPPRHHLLVHPNDAALRGIEDGPARLSSKTGSIAVDVRQSTEVMPGVVSLPHGYGHQRSGNDTPVARGVTGASINDITDPDRVDSVTGNAAFNATPVYLTPWGRPVETQEDGR